MSIFCKAVITKLNRGNDACLIKTICKSRLFVLQTCLKSDHQADAYNFSYFSHRGYDAAMAMYDWPGKHPQNVIAQDENDDDSMVASDWSDSDSTEKDYYIYDYEEEDGKSSGLNVNILSDIYSAVCSKALNHYYS
eukprot:UN06381